MPVTSLTDSLPWWSGQGGPQGGPGAAPMGGGAASAPAGGQPPGVSSTDWLSYLTQMFGISPAQAQQLMSAQQGAGTTADMPSPNAQNVNMFNLTSDDFTPPPGPNAGPGPGNVGPVNGFLKDGSQTPPNGRPPTPIVASLTGRPEPNQFLTGGPELAAALARPPGAGPPPMPNQFQTGGPELAAALARRPPAAAPASQQFMPWRGPMAGDSPANSAAAGGAGPGPLATGGAGGVGATSNPRFVGLDYRPNAPAEGGPYGRSSLQSTALNLAGLFNRGPAVNPNVPAANAQPVMGPLAARPDLAQRVPLDQTPMPPKMPPDVFRRRTMLPNY